MNSAGNPVYSKPFQRYSRLRHEKTNWMQPKTRPKMVRASNRKSALSLWSWSLSDAKKNKTQCQLDAKDWLDHSFLFPGLVFWYGNWKRVSLWMWSLGGSQQPFSCVLGHFRHVDEQTNKQPTRWSLCNPALDQWEGCKNYMPMNQFGLQWQITSVKHWQKI